METEKNFAMAISSALVNILKKDPAAILIGEDIGKYGGLFGCTTEPFEIFGKGRFLEIPVMENGIIGMSIGMALAGLHPIVEIQYADFLFMAMDQIWMNLTQLTKMCKNEINMPVIIRTSHGAGIGEGYQHAHSIFSLFLPLKEINIVVPSTPIDAKGLLISSYESQKPTLFFEDRTFYGTIPTVMGLTDMVSDDYYTIPLGRARIVKEGSQITILSIGKMVHRAADAIKESGVDAELVDLRTLSPLDYTTIKRSIDKTGKLLIINEEPVLTGFENMIVARLLSEDIKFSVAFVGSMDYPVPYSKEKERSWLPSINKISEAMKKLVNKK